jgi:hypothetical protein
MNAAAFKLLQHAATNREQWLRRFYEIGKDAVRPRRSGELWGFAILPSPGQSRILDILGQAGVETYQARGKPSFSRNGITFPENSRFVPFAQPYGAFAKALLEKQHYPNLRDSDGHPIPPYDVTAHTLPLLMGGRVLPITAPFSYRTPRNELSGGGPTGGGYANSKKQGYALFKSRVPSMDEGWTRWMLNRAQVRYVSLEEMFVREGNLWDKFSTIIIPDQPARTILNGYARGAMPEELTGGLGEEGVKALREFVEQGGKLVFLNRASEFAIEQFKLPIRNVVAGVPRREFYVPGSILRLELDTSHPMAQGMPRESIAWAENSPVFELIEAGETPALPANDFSVPAGNVRVIGWYPKDKDPLLSGWLLGGDRIKGKAALVEVKMGQGRIVLFGFRPQYRGQSLATFPLLFNSLK